MARFWKWIPIGLLLTLLLVIPFLLLGLGLEPKVKKRSESVSKTVVISPRMSAQQIAELLEREGIIKNRYAFLLFARFGGVDGKLEAGEYEFSSRMSPLEILYILRKGKVKSIELIIREGYTLAQIAELLEEKGIGSKEKFLSLATDSSLCHQFKIPAKRLEGYLFPATYSIPKGLGEEGIIELMVGKFKKTIGDDYVRRARVQGFSLHEMVTLASIIEKEAKVDEERPLISAVFHNRLKRKMALESCATVLYALGNKKSTLTYRDLEINSPYNTYRFRGLPPGPISNPGKASLQAALYPADVDYLYFVSKNDGTHHFSTTLEEHRWAIREYQTLDSTRR